MPKKEVYLSNEIIEHIKANHKSKFSEYIREAVEIRYNKEKGKKVVSDLMKEYITWRKVTQDLIDDGEVGSVDCGKYAVREDFSMYAGLEEVISFDEMFELEKDYEGK